MDELTIGDKIYISSKQAAKITGYAKDYVGQLCREGRVEARLVGRNWYVLESSIREHRFGAESMPQVESGPVEEEKVSSTNSWQSPTYAAVHEESVLPPLETPKTPLTNPDTAEAVALMQDAWKEWFAAREVAQPALAEEVIEETEEVIIEDDFEPVRVSDISSNEAALEVSQGREEEGHISLTRVHEEVVEEVAAPMEEYVEPVAPARMYAEQRVVGSVIDLSHTYEQPIERIAPVKRVRRRRVRTRGRLTTQAIMLSVAGLVAVMAIIGSGALDGALKQRGIDDNLRGAIFNLVRGESSVKK